MSITSLYHQANLFESIVQALEKAGISKEQVARKDLARFDEFHVGGHPATRQLASQAGLQKGMQVLDMGCGLGGPARLLAGEFGCEVTGIDLTKEYIRTATRLSELTGHPVRFVQGNVLELPFAGNSFDVVWTQHVQMNIRDKKRFYSEAARVLRTNGKLVYYDILKQGNEPVRYPVPWANDASMSFLISSSALRELLQQAGFTQGHQQALLPPALSPTILVDEEQIKNLQTNFNNGAIILESGLFTKQK